MDPIDVTDIQPKPFLNNFTSQSQHKMKSKFKHRITDRFLPNLRGNIAMVTKEHGNMVTGNMVTAF